MSGGREKKEKIELFLKSIFSDIDKIFSGMGDKVGSFIQWTTTFLGGLIVGLIQEWRLALVILAVTPLVAAVAGAMSKVKSIIRAVTFCYVICPASHTYSWLQRLRRENRRPMQKPVALPKRY